MADNQGQKERLKLFISTLGISTKAFEEKCNLSNGYVSSIRRGVGYKAIEQITETYKQLNSTWLLTGTGDMLEAPRELNPIPVFGPDVNILQVPMVSQYAYGSYLNGFSDQEYIDTLPSIPFLVDKGYNGKYMCFEVKGDSMDDRSINSYPEGCIVLCRELKLDLWQYKLHFSEWDFVLVHRSKGIIIKQILNHNPETGQIVCHSLNPLYADFIINISELVQIFNVVKKQLSTKR